MTANAPWNRCAPVDASIPYGRMRMMLYHVAPELTVASAMLPSGLDGCYCEETQTILIDRRLTYTAKRCVLVHELMHWRHGDAGCGPLNGKAERRARRETALALVSPVEYALAEQLYDGEPEPIAQELDVTRQVIEDYRLMLHDGILLESAG